MPAGAVQPSSAPAFISTNDSGPIGMAHTLEDEGTCLALATTPLDWSRRAHR